MIEITDEFIESEMQLYWMLIHRKYSAFRYDEDMQQVGRIAIWRAALNYDKEKGAWSTYCLKALDRSMGREIGRRRRQSQLKVVSLETPMGEDDDMELKDIIPDTYDHFGLAEVDILDKTNVLKPKELEVMLMRRDGYLYKEIAEAIGCSKQNVDRIVKAAQAKLVKAYG